jgi:VIT1/CCC1 family predicted Fe2+/Mn2+ transporter
LILNNQRHIEPHIKESNHIRDFVFGFGDGLNTSLGIVAGVGGANSSADFIILAALVGMFTGAKAMAVQNYLAVKSQREILESEIKREEFERLGNWKCPIRYGIGAELINANLLNF